MQKHAKKLADLLRADAADAGMIRWPINPMRPAHIVTQIDCLIEMIDQIPGMHIKPAELAERIKARRGVSGSPLQWLIGTLLPDVYSKHFGRKAGISRNQNGLGGPYIRFTRQVLIEIEIDCSDEMIASVVHGKILKK
jgi:hypothetical protein